ncbi:MAG TPA: thiol:disulfide interchange protein DsbA/DsbL [Sedimenticola thiotaurini]|uniref:Thiol:disulfide interchange protein n=1 Tax=Sedimenticola thiotaurini TaxID=1543721 RepID=A0A831RJB1_9GAMM|nr:thiol:disulfide interchange protein DsbA/DsbL [Sedimenticola thiotaurini]
MMNKIIAALGLLLATMTIGTLQAAPTFEEDLHYFSVIPEQPGAEGDKVQVVEFFWYACPHCYRLEPDLDAWLKRKPEYVEFDRIPAMFNRPDVVLHAKTYYALRLMGVEGDLHARIFDAIHKQRRRLGTQAEMEEFLGEQGVDLDAYRKAMKSFAVQTQARRAAVLAERFDVRGVPAMVVDGKYRTGGLEAGVLMQVTDFLVEKVRREKAAAMKAGQGAATE